MWLLFECSGRLPARFEPLASAAVGVVFDEAEVTAVAVVPSAWREPNSEAMSVSVSASVSGRARDPTSSPRWTAVSHDAGVDLLVLVVAGVEVGGAGVVSDLLLPLFLLLLVLPLRLLFLWSATGPPSFSSPVVPAPPALVRNRSSAPLPFGVRVTVRFALAVPLPAPASVPLLAPLSLLLRFLPYPSGSLICAGGETPCVKDCHER